MSAAIPNTVKSVSPAPAKTKHQPFVGVVDWRRLVDWLSADGVISQEEARRTIARCSQAESAQHPLVRLASVAMTPRQRRQAAGHRER